MTDAPKKTAAKKAEGIYEKLHAIQKDVEKMAKTGKNQERGYDYLTESDVSKTFKKLFEKHRVFFTYDSIIQEVRPSPTGKQLITDVTVDYEFVDLDTLEKHGGTAAGQGSDATDKGVYKAITGAVKYIFMKTFLIPTGDDPERDTKRPAARASTTPPTAPPFGAGSEDEEED
jgi:hypothetical protein